MKVRIGKLRAEAGAITGAVERGGFDRLGIQSAHLAALARLPTHPDHRDPFDHLLIAQAIAEGAVFLSEDRQTARYPVRTVACSDPPPGR